MKGFFSVFRTSANELKNPVTIAVTGMFIALYVVLKMFATVYVTTELRITFAYLALAAIGMLYGPTVAMASGAIGDILGYFIAPSGGGYFPGYTITYAVEGLIFGLILYHKRIPKISDEITSQRKNSFMFILKLIIARLTVVLVCYIAINTVNRYFEMGTVAFSWPSMSARIIKNTIQLPIDIVIMSVILPSILVAFRRVFKRNYIKG